MKRLTTLAIAALVLGSTQMAAANEDDRGVQLSTTVSYAALDLGNPQAIEILHRRLSNAAEQVCAPLEGRQLWKIREHRQCMSSALSQAVHDVGSPLLTQYHKQKSGVAARRVATR